LGVTVDKSLQVNLSLLKDILDANSDRKANKMVQAAQRYRSISILENVYRNLFSG